MKKGGLLFIGLSVGCACGLWAALNFRNAHSDAFHRACAQRTFFQKEVKGLKEDLAFLESHRKDIEYLTQRGWFIPKNRLIAGEFLESASPPLRKLSYRFDPETVKNLPHTPSFRVTQISVDAESREDAETYAFFDKIFHQFPGILIPRAVTLTRQHAGIKGKFVFEWVAMGSKG